MSKNHITSAEKYCLYLKANGHYPNVTPPETVIFIFSNSLLKSILAGHPHEQRKEPMLSDLYFLGDGKVAVMKSGLGGPELAHKMEKLIALGTKKFLIVGTAGSLTSALVPGDFVICSKALGEDGVSHLYLEEKLSFAFPHSSLFDAWISFIKTRHPEHPKFEKTATWSFPAVFRETKEDVLRVIEQGCSTVEMEAAALYAIAQEKNVQALALFVISDSLAGGEWEVKARDPMVTERLNKLADLAVAFSRHDHE